MTTQKLPGTDAARHGAGEADLTIMLGAHNAFRRDLTRLAGRPPRPICPTRPGASRSRPAGTCSSASCTCTTPPRTSSSGRRCARA